MAVGLGSFGVWALPDTQGVDLLSFMKAEITNRRALYLSNRINCWHGTESPEGKSAAPSAHLWLCKVPQHPIKL